MKTHKIETITHPQHDAMWLAIAKGKSNDCRAILDGYVSSPRLAEEPAGRLSAGDVMVFRKRLMPRGGWVEARSPATFAALFWVGWRGKAPAYPLNAT